MSAAGAVGVQLATWFVTAAYQGLVATKMMRVDAHYCSTTVTVAKMSYSIHVATKHCHCSPTCCLNLAAQYHYCFGFPSYFDCYSDH